MTWKDWLLSGDKYIDGSRGKNGNPSKFRGAILYNLLALSLESYVMAIMDYHTKLPENHTFTDLMDGLETVIPIAPELRHRIVQHEDAQSLCSLDNYNRIEPTPDSLVDLRKAISEIADIAHTICKVSAA